MAFWKVAGFSQPSPIEQILDKEEYTLEELLDEDDIIQECKSLNGRLIAFLREKKTVDQLLRYLIEPPNDPDDPKKQYRYPFTACEVFCCEVEAVFNTLLEDEELLQLLFSLLDKDPPLSCKAAGYFGRVVGQLLLRKTNEMMQYLSNNDGILEKLIKHVDTTSIADIIKRLVGADDHSSMIFLPMHTQWLAETPLVNMLLDRLAPEYSPHVQANAADILTAIAHTQPSALATQLMQQPAIAALFNRALEPGSQVLVTALDVCAALLEPRRNQQEASPDGASPTSAAAARPHSEAVLSMLQYVPQLMEQLRQPQALEDIERVQETPYGVLAPPLGRARLRIVELLAALLRVGDDAADAALIGAGALPVVQQLFVEYPFNNLLHHQMYALLVAALRRGSTAMVQHIFGECALVSWMATLPKTVTPKPRPGFEGKGALRAGYLGHVTRLGQVLQEAAAQQQEVADVLRDSSDWQAFVQQELAPRLEVEDVTHWQCGRPVNTEGGELDSEGDDFQNDMDALEQMQGMPPGMYHRYGVLDDMDDDEDDTTEHIGEYNSSGVYSTDMLVAGMAGLGVNDSSEPGEGSSTGVDAGAGGQGLEEGDGQAAAGPGAAAISSWSLLAHPGASSSAVDIPGERSMDDDAVLLADDEEMGALTASTLQASPPPPGTLEQNDVAAASPPIDDIVMVEQDLVAAAQQSEAGVSLAQLGDAAVMPGTSEDASAADLPHPVPNSTEADGSAYYRSGGAGDGSDVAAVPSTGPPPAAAAAAVLQPAAAASARPTCPTGANPFAAVAGDVGSAGCSEAACADGTTPAAAAAVAQQGEVASTADRSSAQATKDSSMYWHNSHPVPVSDD